MNGDAFQKPSSQIIMKPYLTSVYNELCRVRCGERIVYYYCHKCFIFNRNLQSSQHFRQVFGFKAVHTRTSLLMSSNKLNMI